MQGFEYCEIEVSIGGPLSGKQATGWIFKADGKHDEFEGDYRKMFATMGAEGWEIVSSSARIGTGLGGKHAINYILKRALAATEGANP